ncbi:DUF1573 domain-containing protein [Flavivirga eckloniae]|uniref:DUF1573 domain-containing protein n=1 Tax=Flavivirga eckloniae TaxID=1803846 RepID=A0A2K9PVT4_9FLAO|nr:DUF1573 domain-containing protein [Flavivirga eckloniae]AUP81174.1 hypothetical protein C1H87_21645 [Flavivirga eckloniae]
MKIILFLCLLPVLIWGQTKDNIDLIELEIKNRKYNFGNVKQDTLISKTFILKNVSKKDIALNMSSTSCICTEAKLNKNKLAPNEEAKLIMKFDTTGKIGESKVYAIIDSNTEQQFYRFLIFGNVIKKE